MQLLNSDVRWGAVAKAFHWLIALAILIMIPLGWAAELWPLTPVKLQLFAYHKVLGLCVFVLMVTRLAWRSVNPTPILPPNLKGWEKLAATATHWLLYGIVLLMPISGYVVTSAANFPIDVFGWFEVPLVVPPNHDTQELAALVHLVAFWSLAGLLVLHIAAALRHHFIIKDDALKRMLPGA